MKGISTGKQNNRQEQQWQETDKKSDCMSECQIRTIKVNDTQIFTLWNINIPNASLTKY
jgi:broad specificity polyphosphatase/5'/3'-nucleotidase SurE